MKFKVLSAAITALISANTLAETSKIELPSMIVSADFRPTLAQKTPISLTTIDSETIESRGAQHIEDILNLAPNVNVASGASHGQYFQIRGIGERSQFASPINPSVGLIIDGIDFSRSGGAATLFDIDHVEILRGPQGTRYGTNALAGVINMESKQPTNDLDIHVESGLAQYNSYNLGVAIGGPIIKDQLLGRIAINTNQSDGYMKNYFLHRDNTQNRDEITARGHLKWLVNNDLTVDLNLLHLNIDNGYDAFTLDNSRHSLSDHPGQDKQLTDAFAIKTDWRASDKVQLQSTLTYAKSDLTYSYDADWGYAGQFATSLGPYVGFEQFDRNRKNYSIELRALSNENGRIFNNSTNWVVGLYYLDQNEGLNQNSDFGSFGVTRLNNQYDTQNTAIFGQLDTHLSDKLTFVSGLRIGYFKADYKDSNALNINANDILFGGKLGLNYQANRDQLVYTSLSRGYKSGGVNTDARITPQQRAFDAEYLWNWEAGLKSAWLDGTMNTNIDVFYALRKNAQVKSSIQIGPQFIDLIDNSADGKNMGIETSMDWLINHKVRLLASLGLLHATFNHYQNPNGFSLNGRRQAQAPAYQFSVSGEFYITNHWTFKANIEGKDKFYFSNSHNTKSKSYALVNSSLDYQTGEWKISLWGRNLFNKQYATRGFFFGNDPSINYAAKTYTQFGDPRVVGINVTWDY